MTLNRLEPGALIGDQVFNAIHQGIIGGDLKGGQRLRIRDLAEQLGTSVMPVREALRRLEESGLVETIPYRGAVVREFTHAELLDIYAVRRLLEAEAARLGVTRMNAEDVEYARRAYQEMIDALDRGDLEECLAADERFLSRIYLASGNPVLLQSIERLWVQCRAYKLFGARRAVTEGTSRMLWEYQSSMLEAIDARDTHRMVELSNDSIDAAMQRIREALPTG